MRRPAEPSFSLVPIVVLRHAGFPVELLEWLAAPDLTRDLVIIEGIEAAAWAAATRLKAVLRANGTRSGRAGHAVGTLRPLPETARANLHNKFDAEDREALSEYQEAAARLRSSWTAFDERHADAMRHTRNAVLDLFRADPSLREVLMLSNDAVFPTYERWLGEATPGDDGRRARKMADLLAMYLQRVAAKNETHAHFGPISVGRLDDGRGARWRQGSSIERRTFLTHWAGERLAATFADDLTLFEHVRPRRRPWVFLNDGVVRAYTLTNEDGLIEDWKFASAATMPVPDSVAWLLDQCNGIRTVADLRSAWLAEFVASAESDFANTLARLEAQGWIVCRYEIPVGEPHPLRALRAQLPDDSPAAHQARMALDELSGLLVNFSDAEQRDRSAALGRLKATFEGVSGAPPNRGFGRHYADRAVFYEECHSVIEDLRLGTDLAAVISEELAVAYEIALLGPRVRLAREKTALARWLADRFGANVNIKLSDAYAAYVGDQDRLNGDCQAIDAEVTTIEQNLATVILTTSTPGAREVVVDLERVRDALSRHNVSEPAVLNPDILIAAPDVAAMNAGKFLAVLGECHAIREILTHTSFAPLVHERRPDVLDAVVAGYRSLLLEDEILCDVARAHADKTGSQILYPGPDVEIYGRSPKSRRVVIQPSDLYLFSDGARADLRARQFDGRLRLLAPPTGRSSLREDLLAPFAFPRRLGGAGLEISEMMHVPRVRSGRVVLQRETWRIDSDDLIGGVIGGERITGSPVEFRTLARLRQRLGLPRMVFARVTGEPKPICVDLDSPLLVRQLLRMVRLHRSTVEFSEMLPGPSDLWLRINDKPHTSEIRCCVFLPAHASPASRL